MCYKLKLALRFKEKGFMLKTVKSFKSSQLNQLLIFFKIQENLTTGKTLDTADSLIFYSVRGFKCTSAAKHYRKPSIFNGYPGVRLHSRLTSSKFFFKNFYVLKRILLHSFFFNFYVIVFQESGFNKESLSINYNSSYLGVRDLNYFFTIKSWSVVTRYWKSKLYSTKTSVILATDNHLTNHINRNDFFIIDFIFQNINIVSNSFTVYIPITNQFFKSLLFNYVHRYKSLGYAQRYLNYVKFYLIKQSSFNNSVVEYGAENSRVIGSNPV